MRYDRKRHVWLIGTMEITQHDSHRFEVIAPSTGESAFFVDLGGARRCAEQWELQGKK